MWDLLKIMALVFINSRKREPSVKYLELLLFFAKKIIWFRRMGCTFLTAPCHLFLDEGTTDNSALDEEKKQREHLLALNQVIARQVMEKSRMVAGKSTCTKSGLKAISYKSDVANP